MEQVLKEKVALITGGASGIGRATATTFASAGAAVAIVDLDEEGGESVAREIVGEGGRALFIAGDVSAAEDCRRAVQRTVDALGGLDILFNNAGVIRRASVLELSERDWDQVMAVNVKSIYLMSKYTIPVMEEAGGGVIINTSSGWGLAGGRRAASYCASKGAVVLLTKAMALDHGPQNIRVNCICPGDTDTPMLRQEAEQLGEPIEAFLAEGAQRPLGRLAQPEDIAQAALYLAGDSAAAVTGISLVVDGGGLAGSG
ncbi:MAG: SDR family oxidoreductase [Gemmatimonadales bacterium]|jgi:NAD(P)-dependent dehydrogenase (short-subunit alcohol dehydrogenase family)